MKSVILALAMITSSLFVSAQSIDIVEEQILIEKKNATAWLIGIEEDADLVRKSFITYIKENYELDTKKEKNKAVKVEQSVIPGLGLKAGDLWLVFNTKDDGLRMGFAFFLGYDISINSAEYPNEMHGLKELALEFVVFYKTGILNSLLTENTDRLDELNKSLLKLQKDKSDDVKRIAKIEKILLKEKDDEKRFKLKNENIELKSRDTATSQIIETTKAEISTVSKKIKDLEADLTRVQMLAIDLQ